MGFQKEGTWARCGDVRRRGAGTFTAETPETEVDVIINTRAFQGLSATAMHAAARRFHAALRPGGACIIDTMNVQGALRDRIEDSIDRRRVLSALSAISTLVSPSSSSSSGIGYEMLMGRPRVRRPAIRRTVGGGQVVLDSFRAEYERRAQEEAAEVQAIAEDKTTVLAQVVYATG
jgi:hypothetical protein